MGAGLGRRQIAGNGIVPRLARPPTTGSDLRPDPRTPRALNILFGDGTGGPITTTLIAFLRARTAEDPNVDTQALHHVARWSSAKTVSDSTGGYGRALRPIASRYADHPDYREEWRLPPKGTKA
ncbi:MAG: hypothetical protein JWP39_3532 [Jatrophihabitans sp.]|nr:hypothetical protein [Jatrophihabitans sp.]